MKRGTAGQYETSAVGGETVCKRERVFAYTRYLAILNEGTEPL